MLRLTIKRPAETTIARTQAYRLIIKAELLGDQPDQSSSSSADDLQSLGRLTDSKIFAISTDINGIQSFERVIYASESDGIDDPALARTAELDLWLPAGEMLADQLIAALLEDVKTLLDSAYQKKVRIALKGAGVP